MVIDLIDYWENKVTQAPSAYLAQNVAELKGWLQTNATSSQDGAQPVPLEAKKPTFDEQTIQTSLELEVGNKIVICGQSSFQPTNTYQDLPEVPMTDGERAKVKEIADQLKQNDPQLFIRGVLYDPEKNILYLNAVRADYAFLRAYNTAVFPKESAIYQQRLYKTGVLAPFITQDNYVGIVERNDAFKLNSVASGFLEPVGDAKQLNPADTNIVLHTAKQEAIEEFLGIEGKEDLRSQYEEPVLASVSFRKSAKGLPTVEFIAPIKLQCQKEALAEIFTHNQARDKKEHTGRFELISLDAKHRQTEIERILTKIQAKQMPGLSLWGPVLLSTSRYINQQDKQLQSFATCFEHGVESHPINMLEGVKPVLSVAPVASQPCKMSNVDQAGNEQPERAHQQSVDTELSAKNDGSDKSQECKIKP